MTVCYLLILILCLWGLGLRKDADGDYLSKNQGNAVKGIFILIVILFHANSYISQAGYDYSHWSDFQFENISAKLGQLIVVMFLFFSGYGVMAAVRDRGEEYVKAMPRHRILSVLLNFDVAIVIFALIQLLLGQVFPAKQYLLSLIAWESIGNSNWYIFVILLCYAFTWLSARSLRSNWAVLAMTSCLLCAAYALLVHFKPPHWYNTVVAYPIGMAACLLKDRLDMLKKSGWYWPAVLVMLALLAVTYIHHDDPVGLVHSFRSLVFATLVVLLLMNFRVGNPALCWLGRNLFPLYIYHRLAMIVLAHFNPWGLVSSYPPVFVLLSLGLTLLLVPLANRIQIRL